MSVEVEQVSSFQKRLSFVVPSADVSRKLDEAFRTLSHRVRIPGFRPGKVPRKLLEQRWGRQLRAEVAAEIVNAEFRQEAPKHDFIGQPEVQKADLAEDADFAFAVTIQVKPALEVQGYTGFPVDYPVAAVADADVDAAIGARLRSQTRLVEVERPVQAGDLVLCEIWDGDRQLESGTMVNTAGDRYYPGIEALLVGATKGDTREGSVTIADTSETAALKGAVLAAKVVVMTVQETQVPELTDALATELGFEGGAEAMRAAIRMERESMANDAARNQARINLLRVLVERFPTEVPPALVDKNLRLLLEELGVQAAARGRDPRTIRYTEAQIADLRNRAAFAAKAGLVLEGVARAESIEVTEADLEAKYQQIADQRGQRVEAIRGYIQKEGTTEDLRKHILEERTLDWLLEHSELNYVQPGEPAAVP